MTKPIYRMAITTDRYDLEWERRELAALPDMDIDLWVGLCTSEAEVIAAGGDADALLITSREPMTRDVIRELRRCKVISRYAVGIDHIDLDAATECGIVVTHVPDYCTAEVADHAMALILALNRRLVDLHRGLQDGAWIEHGYHTRALLMREVPPLREQTLGIVGFGRIGRSVAERARPFGLRLIAHDPYLTEESIRQQGVEPVSFGALLAEADIITIHCPLTDETRGMFDAAAFARMKPTATLVNTARGPLVDMAALAEALATHRIAGAGLDVVDPEPLPTGSPLYTLPNTILTPHAAYYSERSVEVVRRETLDGALRVLRGQAPRTVANPAVLQRLALRPYD